MTRTARPVRALHVTGDSKFGGGDLVIFQGLEMLRGRGIDVTFLASNPVVVEQARSRGIRVWDFQGVRRKVSPLADLVGLLRLAWALRGRYEVVHTHTTKAGAIGRLAAYLAGTPVILHTVHGFTFHEFTGALATASIAAVERVLAALTDRLVFVNEYDRLRAIRMGILPARKAVTVYNGLPPEHLAAGLAARREELLTELRLPADAILSVFVGRLAPQKGLAYLLEAVGIAARRRPDLNLHQVILGDGEQDDQCRQWARQYGVSDRVHFLGFRSDAIRWTGVADLFVVSSLWEGHSISLLEAMGCGRPIVVTNIKGNRESITDGVDGLLVRPADAAALAEGMLRLASDRDLAAALGRSARETFQRRFTSEQMLRGTWQVYETVLREKGLLPQSGASRMPSAV